MNAVRHDLDADRITRALDDLAAAGRRIMGTTVQAHAQLGSTMDAAAAWAAVGAPDGAVVIADRQAAGRGRFGRPWETPAGQAIALSLVLRPRLDRERVPQVAMAVALGAIEALEAIGATGATETREMREADERGTPPSLASLDQPRTAPAEFGLKWPNDLVARVAARDAGEQPHLKLGGLLAEAAWRGADATVVVGLGVNVHQAPDELPLGATSLAALGVPKSARERSLLVAAILDAVGRHYARLLAGHDLVPAWSARLTTLGRSVEVRPGTASGTPTIAGRAIGVAPDGALLVVDAQGKQHAVRAADVTLAGS